MRSEIGVLLVDDQPVVRKGFAVYLSDAPGIRVVGTAGNGIEAVEQVRALCPDVVLMDVRMPHVDGISATRLVRALPNPPEVVVVTTFDMDDYLFGALDAGAAGFILKDTEPEDLLAAVRAAADGDSLVSPDVTRRVVAEMVARGSGSTRTSADADLVDPALLTDRERELVLALSEGLSNAEIAERLVVEVSTVKTHLSRISDKVGARDRVQLVVWAFRSGLVSV